MHSSYSVEMEMKILSPELLQQCNIVIKDIKQSNSFIIGRLVNKGK